MVRNLPQSDIEGNAIESKYHRVGGVRRQRAVEERPLENLPDCLEIPRSGIVLMPMETAVLGRDRKGTGKYEASRSFICG